MRSVAGSRLPVGSSRSRRHGGPQRACPLAAAALCGALVAGLGVGGRRLFSFAGGLLSPTLGGGVRGQHSSTVIRAVSEAPVMSDEDEEALAGFQRAGELDDEKPPPPKKYVGAIKSFSTSSGYGFIECKESYEQYRADIWVHKNELAFLDQIKPGIAVQFTTEVIKGLPQARDVEPFMPVNLVDPQKTFIGKIKKFVPAKGFGFLECDESFRIFGCDIFLHKNQVEQAGNPQIDDVVSFTIGVSSKGQPQARNVAKVPGDKFAEGEEADAEGSG